MLNKGRSEARVSGIKFAHALLGLGALLSLAACDNMPSQPMNDHDAFVSTVETAVRKTLRDPESARFSDVYATPSQDIAMGKVNSKNGFGGYAGDESFVYVKGDVAMTGNGDPQYIKLSERYRELLDRDTASIAGKQ